MKKLAAILDTVNGASFIGLTTNTVVALTGGKANPMQGLVEKRNEGASIMVFQNKNSHAYDSMVKRRLESEGKDPATFKLSPRKWGSRLPNMPVVEHKGEYYLEVIYLSAGKSSYTLNGKPIDKADIVGLKESAGGEQGGLNNKVHIRTFKLSSIVSLKIGGVVHTDLA